MEQYIVACPEGFLQLRDGAPSTIVHNRNQATIFKSQVKAANEAKNTNKIRRGLLKEYRGWKAEPYNATPPPGIVSKPHDIELTEIEQTTDNMIQAYKEALEAKEFLWEELKRIDGAILDIEHYGEFRNCNASEGYLMFKKLSELRRERRKVKDKLSIINEIEKTKIYSSTVAIKKDFESLKHRHYTPRVLGDLFKA